MFFYRDGLGLEIDFPPKVFKTRDGHVVEKYRHKGKDGYFVTLAGLPYCAHGATLEQAIVDATWKDEKNRPSLEELKAEMSKDRPISLNEFKTLTGACDEGCRIELKRKGLDGSPMLPKDILENFPEWGKRLYEVLEWES